MLKSLNRVSNHKIPNLMKRVILFALLLTGIAANSSAAPFGQITVSNCYQSFTVPLQGGHFNVLGGAFTFGSTNLLDFSFVDLYEVVNGDTSYRNTLPVGVSYDLAPGTEYLVYPAITPGSFYLGGGAAHLHVVEPTISVSVEPNCLAFGQSFQFDLSPMLSGLCSPPLFEYISPNGTLHPLGYNNWGSISDDGYCTPPPGMAFGGGLRCTTVMLTATLYPCNPDDPNCPPFTITRPLTVCCNNCQPYDNPSKSLNAGEQQVSLYPNPARAETNIRFTLPLEQEMTATLTDIFGRQIAATLLPEGTLNYTIGLFGIAPGIYTLTLTGGHVVQQQKLVIE